MPVREDTYPEPSTCEVGWPVSFFVAFFSHCCHQIPICCWVNSERAFSQGIESDSNRRPTFRTGGMCSNHYATSLMLHTYIHTLLLFLHETSSVKNQYNDIKDKIEKKKWTVLPEGRVSVLCSWHFLLVRCAFSSFFEAP